MTGFVLDASVAAKWFLPAAGEPFTAEALQLLRQFASGDIYFLVPDLFWPELGNILWKAVRSARLSEHAALTAVQSLESLSISTVPCRPLLAEAVGIALRFRRTVHDALYVALAVTSARPLLTADERLANALSTYFPIRWLGSAM